ncbi:MAG: tetratricopeptide repeat protein, partial [Flavobacteriaceae bacterium]
MKALKKLCLVLLWMLPVLVFAQNTEIDSLKLVVEQTQTDTEKAHLLNKIADLYKTQNAELLHQYAQKALEVSQSAALKNEEATAYINLGNYGIISGDYQKALENFAQAQFILEDLNDEKYNPELARVYGSIGIVFSEQSSYNKALSYHLKALKIYENEKDFTRLARVYNNAGIVYKSQNENEKALDYFLKARKIQDSLQDPTIGITTTNIGNSYMAQNQLPQALESYLLAEKQFEKSLNHRGLGELYNNLGLYYQKNQQPEKALEYWNKAIKNFEKINDKFGISDTYFHLGNLYFEQKNYLKAIEFTQKAKLLAQEIATLEMQVLAEKQLRDIYEQTGDFKQALLFGKNYNVLKDSLVNLQNIRKSIQTEMDFEFEKHYEIHKKQQAILKETSKREQLQLLFGSVFLLLVLTVIFLIYNRNQLKKTLTLEKNLAEYEQKALHLQMNPHFVFNCMGSISSFIIQNGNDEALKYLSKFSKLMRLTLEYSKE